MACKREGQPFQKTRLRNDLYCVGWDVKPYSTQLNPFADLRDDAATSQQTTGRLSVEDELSRYKALRVPAARTSTLLRWKEQATDYPILATVARRLFSISASSAQSERNFSSVGRTVTDSRSQLAASKVESIELVRWGLRAGLI